MYPRVCVCFFFGAIPIRTRVFGANIFEFVCESEFPRAPLFERVLFSVAARARGQREREREFTSTAGDFSLLSAQMLSNFIATS